MSNPDQMTKTAPAWRTWGLRALKLAVIVAVVVFVGQTFSTAWAELTQRKLRIDPWFALGAGLLIAAAQLPMAWFWRETLLALDQPAPLGPSVRAFVLSQIGKYVPGKASVVLIRTERLIASVREDETAAAPSTVTIGASVFYETLTHMAVGSLLAAGLAATVPLGDGGHRFWLIALSLGLAAACLTPTLPPVFSWLLKRLTRKPARRDALRKRLSYTLALRGAAASVTSWSILAIAVWMTARSLGAAGEAGLGAFPTWLLAAALPTVAGFVSLLPAGVVVREALTLSVLAPVLGEADALATTLALRLIWVATEALLCGSLIAVGFIGGSHRRSSAEGEPEKNQRGQKRNPP